MIWDWISLGCSFPVSRLYCSSWISAHTGGCPLLGTALPPAATRETIFHVYPLSVLAYTSICERLRSVGMLFPAQSTVPALNSPRSSGSSYRNGWYLSPQPLTVSVTLEIIFQDAPESLDS